MAGSCDRAGRENDYTTWRKTLNINAALDFLTQNHVLWKGGEIKSKLNEIAHGTLWIPNTVVKPVKGYRNGTNERGLKPNSVLVHKVLNWAVWIQIQGLSEGDIFVRKSIPVYFRVWIKIWPTIAVLTFQIAIPFLLFFQNYYTKYFLR